MNRVISGMALFTLLSGCATVTFHTPSGQMIEMSPDEFVHYVEQVNSLHAKVSDGLIRSVGDWSDDDLDDPLQLTAAAKKMVRVCEPFRRIVSDLILSEVTGQHPNLDTVNSVPACEEASKEAQSQMA